MERKRFEGRPARFEPGQTYVTTDPVTGATASYGTLWNGADAVCFLVTTHEGYGLVERMAEYPKSEDENGNEMVVLNGRFGTRAAIVAGKEKES